MKKKKYLIYLFFIALLVFFFIIQDFGGNFYCYEEQDKFNDDEYHGEIVELFLDENNHMYKSFGIASDMDTISRYIPSSVERLYSDAQKGDVLIKNRGENEILLKKTDGRQYSYKVDFGCD